ncbi:hypothetical protein IFM89_008922 [Coptis chinensis]|uniref:Thaumatin-like protein n=1 Tax=Coptis chinensis TaxID=261450 RepID=A0A835H3D8_9MAGN|nr:hypothetical protein IFM89_008922 [Coptis chinensis]
MSSSVNLFSFLVSLSLIFTFTNGTIFEIHNQCSYTVWPAAIPGGGRQLNPGQAWILNIKPSISSGRIWGRTNCTFDSSGRGSCVTGDCNGLLQCQSYGLPPNTMAEYSLAQINQMDFFDISLVDGFNIPMDFVPITVGLRGIRCRADITGQCPNELRTPGGCNGPCPVFNTAEYCCTGAYSLPGSCGPTKLSKFFKDNCPDAYSYPLDQDPANTFTYPNGNYYKIVFCP